MNGVEHNPYLCIFLTEENQKKSIKNPISVAGKLVPDREMLAYFKEHDIDIIDSKDNSLNIQSILQFPTGVYVKFIEQLNTKHNNLYFAINNFYHSGSSFKVSNN